MTFLEIFHSISTRGEKQTQRSPDQKFKIDSLSLQQKFAAIVEHVEQLRERHRQSLKESEDLFDGLMQKAFRGELT